MLERTLAVLTKQVHDFVAARQWCDGHNPKNLVMAISSEVGELCEILRWLSALRFQSKPEERTLIVSTSAAPRRCTARNCC
jgi:hypothetical protein